MGSLGMPEIIVIAIVLLILFGGRKIPQFMKGLGQGIRQFTDAKSGGKKEIDEDKD